MANSVSRGDLAVLLSERTRTVAEGNWAVGAGATPTSIPVISQDPNVTGVDISAAIATRLAGGTFQIILGTAFVSRNIASLTSGSGPTLTLDEALPSAPAQGTPFVILASVNVTVTAPENLAEVGGTAQTGADWTPLFQSMAGPNTGGSAPQAISIGTAVSTNLNPAVANQKVLILYNNGSTPVYLGFGSSGNTVTTSTGLPVAAGANLSVNAGPDLAVYGIVASGTADCRVVGLS